MTETPSEVETSFQQAVEAFYSSNTLLRIKSLVIDKFESERTLYIGNFPDGHIQKRLRERTNFDCSRLLPIKQVT